VSAGTNLAYRLEDLLRVIVLAETTDTTNLYPDGQKGLGNTLELAEKWAAELIGEVQHLEKELSSRAETVESGD